MTKWSGLKKILCVRLDAMGDVLMTGPALNAIREKHPRAQIVLLTSGAGAVAGRLLPGVDEIITFQAPWMKNVADEPSLSEMIDDLRARSFDAAVLFTVYSQNPLPAALLCYAAGIPLRLAHCRENPYRLLTDWVPEREPARFVRHEVQRQLDLVASVGCQAGDERIRLKEPRPEACARVDHALRKAGLAGPGGKFIVVHPGCSAESRRYPASLFAAAITALHRETGLPLLLTGSAEEDCLLEEIEREAGPGAVRLGTLDLEAFAHLLSRAELVISNNTGAVHLAAAVGRRIVDLYALTNPQHTPWQVPSRVLFQDVPCRYCYKSVCPEVHNNCLRGVPPSVVVAAALELLDPDFVPEPVRMPALNAEVVS